MNRRAFLVASAAGTAAYPTFAQASWKLLSPEEEQRDQAAPETPAPPDLPAPPTIELVRPDISRSVQNPVTIEVKFGAGPGREIDMSSLNATYGRLGINITSRLLAHAVTTPNSVSAVDVDLPTGQHRVTLSIADTTGKRASQTFQFSVTR